MDVEERRPLRRADPLVQVAGVEGDVERAEVERQHAGGVGAVDERVDAVRAQLSNDPLDREDERGLAGDVIDEQEARAVGDFREHALDDGVGRVDREGDVDGDDLRAVERADEVEGVARGVVFVRGDEELVVLVEVERAEDGVDAGGGVGDEGEVVGRSAEEVGQHGAGGVEARLDLVREKTHRLALHLLAQRGLHRQDRARRRAEGTVIEERDGRVEEPVLFHTMRAIPSCRTSGSVRSDTTK